MGGDAAGVPELLEQASALRNQNRLDEAAAAMEKACDLVRQNPLLKAPLLVEVLLRLSTLHIQLGNYQRAREVLDEALAEEGVLYTPGSAPATTIRNNLAAIHLYEGRYEDARRELLAVLEAQRKAVPVDRESVARTLSNLSRASASLDQPAEAEGFVWEAFELLRSRGEEGSPLFANILHNIAVLHMEAGRLGAANHYFELALEALRKAHGEESLECAAGLHEMARLCGMMRRHQEGFDLARRAAFTRYRILGDRHTEVAIAFQTAGLLARDAGNFQDAYTHFKSAYQVFTVALGQWHPKTVLAILDMLTDAWKAGDLEDAEFDLRNMIAAGRETGTQNNPLLFRALTDLAGLLQAKGEHQGSVEAALESEQLLHTLKHSGDDRLRPYFFDLAAVLLHSGHAEKVVPLFERIAAVDDRLIEHLTASRDEALRKHYVRQLAESTSEFVRTVLDRLPADPAAGRAAFRLVLNRKGLLAEAFMVENDPRLGQLQPELTPLLEQARELRAEILEQQVAGPVDGWNDLLSRTDRLKRRLREIESRIEAQTRPENRPQRLYPSVTVEAVAGWLPQGSVLVEFYALHPRTSGEPKDPMVEALERDGAADWLGPEQRAERYAAFVLRAGDPASVRLIDFGEAGPLENLVYSWLTAMNPDQHDLVPRERQDGLLQAAEGELSRKVRRAVFDPLSTAIGESRMVIVAPDGVLCRLPFSALLEDGAADRRLIDDFTFSFLTTGRATLLFGAGASQPPGEPFVLGDPDYDLLAPGIRPKAPEAREDFPGFYFPRLEGTREEARKVSAWIGGRLLLGRKAHEAVLRDVRSPAILHLATHGYYIRPFSRGIMVIGNWRTSEHGPWLRREVLGYAENPFVRSGIVLAGANAWAEARPVPPEMGDGLMNSIEVAHLDLRGTELVVLSACGSALGDVRLGEGVAGLLHGFHVAGAASTIATLWEIPDEVTVRFMEALYRGLLDGLPRHEALSVAQRALQEEGCEPWEWSAFVCYGEPTPLRWCPSDQSP